LPRHESRRKDNEKQHELFHTAEGYYPVPDRLHIVVLNLAYDPALTTPDALLQRYTTLVEWSRAMAEAGARVDVVQRFSTEAAIEVEGVACRFVVDGDAPLLDAWTVSTPAVREAVALAPDVVHVNGLMFPAMAAAVRDAVPRAAIVLQDHSGYVPRGERWGWPGRTRARWAGAFQVVDAITFTARELAQPWTRVGLPLDVPILEIIEASTALRPIDRHMARHDTGIGGSPAVLWVGRLNDNKDPHTVLDGLEQALTVMPEARCWMVYANGPLESALRGRLDRSAVLGDRVTLVGRVPHTMMASYYSAADLYVSGSRHEGSGYALIEAMACGVTPVVTDISPFRAIAGACGERWTPGDAGACAAALQRAASRDRAASADSARRRFEQHLSWPVIARRTLESYAALGAKRQGMAP
jgi:glycosyltransferase involved in cell wall biosynthesis